MKEKDYEPIDLMLFQTDLEKIMYHLDQYIKLTKNSQAVSLKYMLECKIEVARLNDKWI